MAMLLFFVPRFVNDTYIDDHRRGVAEHEEKEHHAEHHDKPQYTTFRVLVFANTCSRVRLREAAKKKFFF